MMDGVRKNARAAPTPAPRRLADGELGTLVQMPGTIRAPKVAKGIPRSHLRLQGGSEEILLAAATAAVRGR
jgi:hypothetical protein